ncbi:hypothetical protein GUJ93_ZPchr0007g4979 [Zizania palustris]|uniref:Phorbol-ester/DAG-type domain-containing protein n=1 Tax=Zizania palustris TaxID=103762 RepID=A0A8J5TFI6_ZIZPA|nr:hypothetical protein GUJ93_ZPchr0007g4979 [Zizania palustris]
MDEGPKAQVFFNRGHRLVYCREFKVQTPSSPQLTLIERQASLRRWDGSNQEIRQDELQSSPVSLLPPGALPRQIPVQRAVRPWPYVCDLCGGGCSGLVGYRCEACDFDIHEECADHFQPSIYFFAHTWPHSLALGRVADDNRICDMCTEGCPRGSFVYRCVPCGFDVHPLCSTLRAAAWSPLHPQNELGVLTASSLRPGHLYHCSACGEPCSGWFYSCGFCRGRRPTLPPTFTHFTEHPATAAYRPPTPTPTPNSRLAFPTAVVSFSPADSRPPSSRRHPLSAVSFCPPPPTFPSRALPIPGRAFRLRRHLLRGRSRGFVRMASWGGRGRGRGGRWGRSTPFQHPTKHTPHENFPEIALPAMTCTKATIEEKALILSTLKFEDFWKQSCYHLEEDAHKKKNEDKEIERYSDRKHKTQAKREALAAYLKLTPANFPAELIQGYRQGQTSNKRLRWDRGSDEQAFEVFEKLEEKGKDGEKKADKDGGDEDEQEAEEVEEEENSDDDYNQVSTLEIYVSRFSFMWGINRY